MLSPNDITRDGTGFVTVPQSAGGGLLYGGAFANNTDKLNEILYQCNGGIAILNVTRNGVTIVANPVKANINVGIDTFVAGVIRLADGKYYAGATTFYDNINSQFATNAIGSSLNQFGPPVRVGTGPIGLSGGWICEIPSNWQAAFGGNILTGYGCDTIISRTSWGPAATVWNPNTGFSKWLLGYTQAHPSLGDWSSTGNTKYRFGANTSISDIIWYKDTILFIGGAGLGPYTYGEPVGYDPVYPYAGPHSKPYTGVIWAYDPNDLLKVLQSQLNPWDIYPVWVKDIDISDGAPEGQIARGSFISGDTLWIGRKYYQQGNQFVPFKISGGTDNPPPPPMGKLVDCVITAVTKYSDGDLKLTVRADTNGPNNILSKVGYKFTIDTTK